MVTAHTGSGKTLPAEFAIEYFISKGKKVIYTGPIKALINEKFYNFTQKFPHITFGIITGDIKCNPEAQVLLVTAEILLNKLYSLSTVNSTVNSTSFDMNIENELACVVMDEIHYINDADRGKVWESTIMLLPKHIQLVLLSATIDKPEKFARWIEEQSTKCVYLTGTNERIVPLTHYSFITSNTGIFKTIKDKTIQEEIRNIINKPFVIQSAKGEFQEQHYHKMHKTLKLFDTHKITIKRQHVLNEVTTYMVEKELYPALFFVLSRKQLEKCAHEITTNLLEFDSKVPYIIDHECEQIIRKIPNYAEYLHLPEYIQLVSLLRKGIAIHHGGMLPILKEMVEMLFGKGYIKILFATETFAVGINAPIKTVVFTDINKFDGHSLRILHGSEYGQMSGRAGRRGIDKVGHVIHLNNLFRPIDSINYRNMMKGTPQILQSKFKISYNLLLNQIESGLSQNFNQFIEKSMIKQDIDVEIQEFTKQCDMIQHDIDKLESTISLLKTPKHIVEEYIICLEERTGAVNKKRKELDKKITTFLEEYKFIDSDKVNIQKLLIKQKDLKDCQKMKKHTQEYISVNIRIILDFLSSQQMIELNEERNYILLEKGTYAIHLREVHCLVFANLLHAKVFESLKSTQMIALFSCFTNVSVSEDFQDIVPKSNDKIVQNVVLDVKKQYNYYLENENDLQINTGTDYNIHFDLLNYVEEWAESCIDEITCKLFLQKIEIEKGIFLGEFVKALLKIVNIASELEKVVCNVSLLHKLKEIPTLLLKFVVTNQSLYV